MALGRTTVGTDAWGDGDIAEAKITSAEEDAIRSFLGRTLLAGRPSNVRAIALRAGDGHILGVLMSASTFTLLHRIAAIAASPDHYAAVQREAAQLRGDGGGSASSYVDARKVFPDLG
jgi:hypothetical protein